MNECLAPIMALQHPDLSDSERERLQGELGSYQDDGVQDPLIEGDDGHGGGGPEAEARIAATSGALHASDLGSPSSATAGTAASGIGRYSHGTAAEAGASAAPAPADTNTDHDNDTNVDKDKGAMEGGEEEEKDDAPP